LRRRATAMTLSTVAPGRGWSPAAAEDNHSDAVVAPIAAKQTMPLARVTALP
jgi:hypothetical protein